MDRGYWVSKIYKYQALWYYTLNAIYYRSLTYFSAANPAMHLGGMLDDRKTQVYDLVDRRYLPQTILVDSTQDIQNKLDEVDLLFPLMLKPDVGYKGIMVRKVDDIDELKKYVAQAAGRAMLVQDYIDLPREYSIMCYRLESEARYRVSSLVEKHLPTIVGDGVSTVSELIDAHRSPFLDKGIVRSKLKSRMEEVLDAGEYVIVDHAGNYARGGRFESHADRINERLEKAINCFFSNVNGINFGRLDVKAESIEALYEGDFVLLEINGAKAEPIQIYDPRLSMMEVVNAISAHWKILLKIVHENKVHAREVSSWYGIQSLSSLNKMVGK